MSKAVIYAIAAPGIFVKFGIARNPHNRMRSLQTSSPYELKLLAVSAPVDRDMAYKLEWAVHRALFQFHVRGEWFRSCPKSLMVVELLKSQPPKKLFDLLFGWINDQLAEAIRHQGGIRIDGAMFRDGRQGPLM